MMDSEITSSESSLDPSQLAVLLEQLGCPAEKSLEMAQQLDRRADQLAGTTGKSKMAALQHLIGLMRQGWAAKEKGL